MWTALHTEWRALRAECCQTSKKRTDSSNVFKRIGKVQKGGER